MSVPTSRRSFAKSSSAIAFKREFPGFDLRAAKIKLSIQFSASAISINLKITSLKSSPPAITSNFLSNSKDSICSNDDFRGKAQIKASVNLLRC